MDPKSYTTDYEWFFPYAPRLQANGHVTWAYEVMLTVPQLTNDEREHVLARFHQRLDWLSRTLQEVQGFVVTDQLRWRCLALTYVQMQQAFFDEEQVGFLLLANGVAVQREILQLHVLLQSFQSRPPLPDMGAYYRLPAYLARPEDGSLEQALSVSGSAQCAMEGWTYQLDWNPLAQTGVLLIAPTTGDPCTKPLASKDARDRALYEPGEEYPPISRQQHWLPCC